MNVINDRERQAMLTFLTENISDEVLIRTLEQIKEDREYVRDETSKIMRYIGAKPAMSPPVPTPTTFPPSVVAPEAAPETKNVSPGAASITKIGANAKGEIMAALKVGPRTLREIGSKYTEHLKLLWARQEVKYDGERYYL
jgi:ApbE superfamily uncharacterized protein (UPF0280 family)